MIVAWYRRFGKRFVDLAAVIGSAPVWLPISALLAMLVRANLGSPVLYRQVRPGKNGVPFVLWKFRTMTQGVDDAGEPLPDHVRLTRFGRWLRSTSLDELPELINILNGDMSLVGPRPLLVSYLPLYNASHARRHDILPGLSGWAQVNGRNDASWGEKFDADVWYLNNCCFSLDVRILVLTVLTVIRRDGITQNQHATTSRFEGYAT